MENEKNPNYDQDGPNPVKEPRTQNLKADPDTYLDMEEEELFDPDAPLYPNQSRNSLDSISADDIQNKDEEEEYEEEDEDEDENEEEEDEEDDDDFNNEEVFEEDGDFEEKDIDYREKKERDSF